MQLRVNYWLGWPLYSLIGILIKLKTEIKNEFFTWFIQVIVSWLLQKLFCIIFKNKANSCFSTFMAEKKAAKKTPKKTPKKTAKAKTVKNKVTKSKAKSTKSKGKKVKDEPIDDMGIVIVDDDIVIDQEKVNEERRAYLEEARSQEAFD